MQIRLRACASGDRALDVVEVYLGSRKLSLWLGVSRVGLFGDIGVLFVRVKCGIGCGFVRLGVGVLTLLRLRIEFMSITGCIVS